MTAVRGWPRSDLDLAAELRRHVDELTAKCIGLQREIAIRDDRVAAVEQQVREGNAEREVLRKTLLGEADLADAQCESPDVRGASWWKGAWREVRRHNAELNLRIQKLERWLDESGREATGLQTERDTAREEIGQLTRQLELARAGERCDSREVD